MVKVGLYEARGLAKQAVGTPGIDKTGAIVENFGGDLLKATDNYIQAENAKIKIANNILAETEKIKWENELFNQVEQAKQDPNNINNPMGLADSIFNTAQNSASSYAKTISNPRAREMFLQKSVSTIDQAQTAMRRWASDQITTNAFISVKEGIDAIRMQAGKMKDPAGFNGLMSQGEALIVNAAPVIGAGNAYKLRTEMRKGIAEDFIYSKIDSSPNTVKAYLQSGMFDGIYDEKEKLRIEKTADSLIKRNEVKQKAATAVQATDGYQTLLNKAYSGNISLMEVNSEIRRARINGVRKDSKQMQNLIRLRDAVVSTGGYRYATSDSLGAINQIDKVFGLIENTGTSKDPNYKLKNATLNQLQEMQDILDENSIYLTESTLKKKYEVLNQAWENHVKNNQYVSKKIGIFQTKGFPVDEYNTGLRDGYKYCNTNYKGDRANQAKRIFSQTYNLYYDYERKQPGYTYQKFLRKVKNHVDSVMNEG